MIEFDDKHGHVFTLGIDKNSSDEKGIIIETDNNNIFLRKEELEKFLEILNEWKEEL